MQKFKEKWTLGSFFIKLGKLIKTKFVNYPKKKISSIACLRGDLIIQFLVVKLPQ
jgi:hypothetical protein